MKRKIEVFTAGCPACDEAIALVNRLACPSCEVQLLDMRDKKVAAKARKYGVKRVPAVAVDGTLAECCKHQGVSESNLRSAGVGARRVS